MCCLHPCWPLPPFRRMRWRMQGLDPVGLADAYASLRLEIGSAYTLVFFLMIVPLLVALQWLGQARPTKFVAEDE
mgnify:CR=1 FL=1